MPAVLVIDDDRSVRHIVTSGLQGYLNIEVSTASDGDIGLQLLEETQPEVLLLDVFLPEHHGLELFRKIRALDHRLPVIFITGDTASETAIEAMRAGAYDYLSKPLDIRRLRNLVASALRSRRLMDEPVGLPVGSGDQTGEQFVGTSPAMIEVFKDIGRVASQNVTVLVRGESGSGKELVARALVNHSDRADKPFVAVNCAAIPDQLLESELFGHERGAFTGAEKRRVGRFEQCHGGTIFLDEIGDMSAVTQGKVLRLLQDQKFERVGGNDLISTDVRVIAATNRPLEKMVKSDDFREDLLYRLNSFTIELPPLRARQSDIAPLLEYFLRRAKSEMNREELEGIAPDALELLVNYAWPGNVRQLQSVVRQSLLNTTGTVIGVDSLPQFVRKPDTGSGSTQPEIKESCEKELPQQQVCDVDEPVAPSIAEAEQQAEKEDRTAPSQFLLMQFVDKRLQGKTTNFYGEVLEEVERRLFMRVLQFTSGNQSRAAEILGVTRGKVRDRIASYNIQLDQTVTLNE